MYEEDSIDLLWRKWAMSVPAYKEHASGRKRVDTGTFANELSRLGRRVYWRISEKPGDSGILADRALLRKYKRELEALGVKDERLDQVNCLLRKISKHMSPTIESKMNKRAKVFVQEQEKDEIMDKIIDLKKRSNVLMATGKMCDVLDEIKDEMLKVQEFLILKFPYVPLQSEKESRQGDEYKKRIRRAILAIERYTSRLAKHESLSQ